MTPPSVTVETTAVAVRTAHAPSSSAVRVVVDAVLAAGLLVLISPLLLVAAVAVRVTSRGPAFFRQERVGMDGRRFMLWKLRTMTSSNDDAAHRRYIAQLLSDEPEHGGVPGIYKLARDTRVTRVGGFLRKTSLDELPQLLNVVRGDMALVGPRPVLAWEAEMFPSWAAERFRVRPGLTGLWQVNGRSRLGMKDALRLDVEYVRTRSLRLDVRILARTPLALLGRSGGAR